MKRQYLYIVGKPDMHTDLPRIVHELGYKLGILLDEKVALKHPEQYDRIESVRFEELDEEIERLDTLNLSMAGLLCTYESYVIAKAKLGTHFNVPALSIESARLTTDKFMMRQAFLDTDRSITPDFARVDSAEQAISFGRSHGFPVILKPANLVKSLLVLRCNSEQELIDNFNYAQSSIERLYKKYRVYEREPQIIVEELIVGKQCSIAAFVDSEGTPHFCDGIAALTNAQDIHIDDNYLFKRVLPGTFSDTLAREMYRVAEVGIKALKMRSTPAHVELMYSDEGVKIIEIGARIGGYRPRMYRYGYDIDLNAQEVRLALGKRPDLTGTFHAHTAAYELFPTAIGAFAGISGSVDASMFAYYRVAVKSGAMIGPAKDGYKAAAIVIVAEKGEEAFRAKCNLAESLSVVVST